MRGTIQQTRRVILVIVVPAATLALLSFLLPQTGLAHPDSELHVCLSGCAYSSIQSAVDAAQDGDLIKVAAGVYTGVQPRLAPPGYWGPSVVTQVVYISKAVSLMGGYTMTDWSTSYTLTQPTIVDAQGAGRGFFVVDNVGTTLQGLHITNSSAQGLNGHRYEPNPSIPRDAGGGIYVMGSTAFVTGNHIFSNTDGYYTGIGAGIYAYLSSVLLDQNTIFDNFTSGDCGGLAIVTSTATIQNNTVYSNYSGFAGAGGLCLDSSEVTLRATLL